MKGRILAFSNDVNTGVILSEDGNHHCFAITSWLADDKPRSGLDVEFNPRQRFAADIRPIPGRAANRMR